MIEHEGRKEIEKIMKQIDGKPDWFDGFPITIRVNQYTLRFISDFIKQLEDKIEGLECDLDNAVETALARGAVEWAKANYPNHPKVRALMKE